MTLNQLFPLETDPKTGEPFLRLRKHPNVILTPMRWEDAPHFVPIFNDPRVYQWLMRTPFPYAHKDAEDWLQIAKPKSDALLQELLDAQGSDKLKTIDGCPVPSIREVKEDGTQVYIGNITFGRCMHPELIDTDTIDHEHAEEKKAANDALQVGDPKIIYSIGDYLDPKYHGQGIMTDALDTILHEWAIPRMNVRRILTGAFIGNVGSVRVFQKNGFKMLRTVDEFAVVRGTMRGLHVLEWRADEDPV
ncbi:hypothetical protein D9613_004126 [Agrocybe pediades]|uniref:N-acetyltransferase domain-containing protein n=1 Tax=Agrocybe pediades TaxID=84607 RepID=A0A8H4QJP4_9AGAR|nr:hypothetical protein D9613_004126 [Agrocybe pediades]